MTDTRDSLQSLIAGCRSCAGVTKALGHTPESDAFNEIADRLTALQSGAGDGWSGWALQYPNKLPYLYGAKEIALLNYDPESDARLIYLMEAIDNAQATQGHDMGVV